MKKTKSMNLSIILTIIFSMFTIILYYIIYKKIDNQFSYKFVMSYLIFLFVFVAYLVIKTIVKMKSLKWFEIKKRLLRCICIFVLLFGLNFAFDYLFRHSKIDLSREFSVALGTAIGISFIDMAFIRKDNNEI